MGVLRARELDQDNGAPIVHDDDGAVISRQLDFDAMSTEPGIGIGLANIFGICPVGGGELRPQRCSGAGEGAIPTRRERMQFAYPHQPHRILA